MLNLAKELYPLNRSLMGPDIKFSLQKFIELNGDFRAVILTGQKVFDWEIPEEWIIRDAYVEHESEKDLQSSRNLICMLWVSLLQ